MNATVVGCVVLALLLVLKTMGYLENDIEIQR